jgi:DNA-binding NarL/FixJ family response regulator
VTRKRPNTILPHGLRAATLRVGKLDLLVLSYEEGKIALPDALSKGEREVAEALLKGKSNQDIADARGTSVRTVANQVASVFRKCGVASRAELIAKLRG